MNVDFPFKTVEFDQQTNSFKIIDLSVNRNPEAQCSTCGKYKPYTEFCDEDGKVRQASCRNCRELPAEKRRELSNAYRQCQKDKASELSELASACHRYNELSMSRTVKDLIRELQQMDPDAVIRVKNYNGLGTYEITTDFTLEASEVEAAGKNFKVVDIE